MPLTTYLTRQVPSDIRARGADYFQRRKVKILEGNDWLVDATVRGTEVYDVSLTREDDTLTAWCSCPYCEDRYEICKHIWATVLAAEPLGYLLGDNGEPPLTIDLVEDAGDPDDFDPEPYDDDEGDEFDDEPMEYMPPPPRKVNTPKAPRKQRLPDWKRTLAHLQSPAAPDTLQPAPPLPAGQHIVYIVDVANTLTGNGLALEVATRALKKDGTWGKPTGHRFDPRYLDSLPDPADRQALALLIGARESVYYGYGYYNSGPVRYFLPTAQQRLLLPIVCATGRCFVRPMTADAELKPLHWDEGGPWEFWLKVAPDKSGKHYLLTGELRRGEQRLPLSTPLLLTAGGVVLWDDRVAPLQDLDAFNWILLLRKQPEVAVPAKHKDDLLAELLRQPQLPRLDLPEDMHYEEAQVAPRPLLHVNAAKNPQGWGRDQTWLEGELHLDYDGQVVAAKQPGRQAYDPEKRRLLRRDPEAERAALTRLIQAGFHVSRPYYAREDVLQLPPTKLPKVVRQLIEEGWRVEAEGKLYRQPGAFNIEVTSGIDWFELHGGATFGDEEVPLPTLLAALKRGDGMVPLGDGSMGMLPEKWLEKYGVLAGLGTLEGDHLRFGRTQVGLLDALLAEQPEAKVDEQFAQARDQLRQFQGIAPAEAPAGFVGTLRGYQHDGLGWLHFLRDFRFGGCLADDMGLGKTVQVLALLEGRRELRETTANGQRLPPSLVVVPRSLIFNWKQEAARFTPKLRILDHTGIGREKPGKHFGAYDLILTTYGTLRRDIAQMRNYAFDHAILDEAQAIKNASSQSAKAARLLRAEHRLVMSGTPVENHLGELWSLFEFLNPGMLGHASLFRLGEGGLKNPSEESRALLAKVLRPFLLRRTKAQVAKDLPDKTEQTLYCDLEPAQRKLYDELREHYRQSLLGRIEREGIQKAKIQILEALLRLRQAACHPGLIDKKKTNESSAKLDNLLPQLQEVFAEGHKTLVFSQFTSLLAIVKKRLDAEGIPYEYLDGRTRDRASRVERFQTDPDCKLFLISLKAGGLGLNLTAADYVYLLDPWWNPAVEAQAIDRAHRIGQTRPVFAYRLIARDTVEEKVLQLQEKKRALADAIITADNSMIRDLGREDLELLLS